MFDDGEALALEDDREIGMLAGPRCEACGARNPAGYNYCHECGARAEGTLAYGAVVHLTLAAEWFGRPTVTAVSTPRPCDELAAARDGETSAGDAEVAAPIVPANDGSARVSASSETQRRAMDLAWLQMIDRLTASPADLVWESLASEDVTAVWSSEEQVAVSTVAQNEPESAFEVATTVELARPVAVPEPIRPSPTVELPVDVVEACASVRTELAAVPRAATLIQLAADGYPGQGTPIAATFVARGGAIDIGRECPGLGADDPYLEPWHVRLSSHADGLQVHDPGTRGGVWMRLRAPHWLRDGDRFRLGGQFLCFDATDGARDRGARSNGERGRIQLTVDGERSGLALAICETTVLGRAGTDVVLVDDPYVSVAHCRLVPEGDGVRLEDLGSSNGTWVRLRCGDVIPFGSLVAIGQSVARVECVEP